MPAYTTHPNSFTIAETAAATGYHPFTIRVLLGGGFLDGSQSVISGAWQVSREGVHTLIRNKAVAV